MVAVEPSGIREKAADHSHPRVVGMDDALPDLKSLRALGRHFAPTVLEMRGLRTYPGSAGQHIFEPDFVSVQETAKPIVLSREYLS